MKTLSEQPASPLTRAAFAPADSSAVAAEYSWRHLLQLLLVAFQFGLLILTVRAFEIENKAFLHLIVFSFFAFLANHFVPPKHRMQFFGAVSIAGVVLVFGVLNAAWVVGTGVALIAMAHIPIRFSARIAIVCVAGAALAFLRVHPALSPVPNALWPILGSMFMFRMMMYMYELKQARAPFSIGHSISYFFMLPNVCFPMFPLVDYKTFCDSHYSQAPIDTYQKGVYWCFQGVLHILLYRIIYQNVVIDPSTVADASDAARHIASNYLVYLRFTGSFHLVIGLLYLFGFSLPRVFHYWLLASGFSDMWRRVNIYWKNFIQKLVFYPVHFWLRGKVSSGAILALAILFTFGLTWALHSYQFFWIRGEFPVLVQDIVFWSVIGIGVFANMLIENRFGRKRSLKPQPESALVPLVRALKTIAMFIFMALAWTYWMAESASEAWHIISSLFNMTKAAAVGIPAVLLSIGVAAVLLGGKPADLAIRKSAGSSESPGLRAMVLPALPNLVTASFLLVAGTHPVVFAFSPKLVEIADGITSGSRLSERDSKALERGYYEDLTNVSRFNDELAELMTSRPPNWNVNEAVQSHRTQFPPFSYIPSVSVDYKGAVLTTNKWGMHDREYTREKSQDTFRIALLGSSHTVGIGVTRDQTYESLVEERLNREFAGDSGVRFEILNFAVSGYGPTCGLVSFEKRVSEFDADAILIGGMDDITWIVNETVNASAKNIPIPYDALKDFVAAADVTPGTPQALGEQRLNPHAREMLAWVYSQYVSRARQQGIIPFATVLPRPENLTERVKDLDVEQEAMMKEAGFVMLDTYDAFAGARDPSKLWIRKYDRHPDAAGHQLLADALYRSLTGALAEMGLPQAVGAASAPGGGARPEAAVQTD